MKKGLFKNLWGWMGEKAFNAVLDKALMIIVGSGIVGSLHFLKSEDEAKSDPKAGAKLELSQPKHQRKNHEIRAKSQSKGLVANENETVDRAVFPKEPEISEGLGVFVLSEDRSCIVSANRRVINSEEKTELVTFVYQANNTEISRKLENRVSKTYFRCVGRSPASLGQRLSTEEFRIKIN